MHEPRNVGQCSMRRGQGSHRMVGTVQATAWVSKVNISSATRIGRYVVTPKSISRTCFALPAIRKGTCFSQLSILSAPLSQPMRSLLKECLGCKIGSGLKECIGCRIASGPKRCLWAKSLSSSSIRVSIFLMEKVVFH